MADYSKLRARVDLYVKLTGLPRATVNEFRRTPAGEWSRRSDRRIGRALRGLERLWRDPDVSERLWRRTARGVLGAVHDFLDDVITTASELAIRIATEIDRALLWVERTAQRVEDLLKRYPRLAKALKFIGSTVPSIAAVAYRSLPARA